MPDPADLLVDFLNTKDVEEPIDLFDEPGRWEAWAAEHGLGPGDPAQAREVRDRLRDVAEFGPAEIVLPAVPLLLSLDRAGSPVLAGPGEVPEAAGTALGWAAVLAAQGRLDRVKICPADDCQWAFYDRSRNHSRTWCSMAVCGNRSKTRAFRAR